MTHPASMTPRLFCFGMGYSATALSATLAAQGWQVAGTSRTARPGIHVFDGRQPMADAPAALAGTSHLLISVPPDGEGCPVLRHHLADLTALPALAWVGYLSTTGVYGDHQGGWVDETTTPKPGQVRSVQRLRAEQDWQASGLPVHVFRLAGIYGPGRSALDRLRAGDARRIDKPGHLFSRIHVADIARVLLASMDRPDPGAIYNVCDDEPTESGKVTEEAARLLNLPAPPAIPFEEATLTPMAASFYAESRLVRNDRIKRELGVQLACPTYREGLAAILAEERGAAHVQP